jgi:hypothetical protein
MFVGVGPSRVSWFTTFWFTVILSLDGEFGTARFWVLNYLHSCFLFVLAIASVREVSNYCTVN